MAVDNKLAASIMLHETDWKIIIWGSSIAQTIQGYSGVS
jgi:hypothetical protein